MSVKFESGKLGTHRPYNLKYPTSPEFSFEVRSDVLEWCKQNGISVSPTDRIMLKVVNGYHIVAWLPSRTVIGYHFYNYNKGMGGSWIHFFKSVNELMELYKKDVITAHLRGPV